MISFLPLLTDPNVHFVVSVFFTLFGFMMLVFPTSKMQFHRSVVARDMCGMCHVEYNRLLTKTEKIHTRNKPAMRKIHVF